MSGEFVYSVNNIFDKADQSNVTAAVAFYEILKYIDSHSYMDFVGYGTGSTQTGIIPPLSWTDWDYTVDPPPFSDNSWFVFNATNASKGLDGTGDQQWQAKIQFTLASAFDDASGADYEWEGETYTTCIRVSADGGWNSGTRDFVPSTNSEPSNNYRLYAGQDESFRIDIIGDDDTIFWRGNAGDAVDHYNTRQCYLGMVVRRDDVVTNPFFMMCGCIYDGYSDTIDDLKRNSCYQADGYRQWAAEREFRWPTYSLSQRECISTPDNGIIHKIEEHYYCKRYPGEYNNVIWYRGDLSVNTEFIWSKIPIREQHWPVDFSIIGELRFLVDTTYQQVYNADDPEPYIEIVPDRATYGGVGMRYPPASEVPAAMW
jgi:hypothetical protein